MQKRRTTLAAALGTGVIVVLGMLVTPASAQEPSAVTSLAAKPAPAKYKVVAKKLHNPRNLSVGPAGALYVAEAGFGGPTSDSCFVASAGANVCPGNTGSITKITVKKHKKHKKHEVFKQHRVVKGLPSLAPPPGSKDARTGANSAGTEAAGPSAVLVTGKRYTAVIGFGAGCEPAAGDTNPAPCDPWAEHDLSPLFGTVVTARFGHTPKIIGNVAQHEYDTNPIDNPDSNPVSLTANGWTYVVADAGANTVNQVGPLGYVQTLAQFPDVMVANPMAPPGSMMPMQSVPTDAVVGPDGALYVSQLTGFPFPKGASTIWRIARGHAPVAFATGLTNVTSLTFGPDGRLYVVETAANGLLSGSAGDLVRISANGKHLTVVASGLPAPYGVAIQGRHAYVTVNSASPKTGKVLQIPLRGLK